MRQAKAAVMLLLGIVIGCAAERLIVVPPARAGTSPQRWEYACRDTPWGTEAKTQMANQFGEQGWDLAGVIVGSQWCFKRPLP
jgi:hypothetical protein